MPRTMLFRYPGGKYYAMGILKPFFSIKHEEYREPFVGGGSVFFTKDEAESNWLNDLDRELMTCYKQFQNPVSRKRLIDRLCGETASPERWREVMDMEVKSDEDVAFKYYYLNRTSFSGKLAHASWGYRPKRSLPPERWHERIGPCGNMLDSVKLTSIDFEEVIKAPSDKEVLMYVDPPYYAPPMHKHYRFDMTTEEHSRLAEVLRHTKHKFFLTYDDCKEVRNLYDWAFVTEISFFYRVNDSTFSGNGRKMGFELVITNFDPKQVLSEEK